jgi:nitronate monooxygenase
VQEQVLADGLDRFEHAAVELLHETFPLHPGMRRLDLERLADQNLKPTCDPVKRIALRHVTHRTAQSVYTYSTVETELTRLLGTRHPLIQAPMAGGPTTTDLVVAVCEAGALGSIAGAASSPDALREWIREVRARTDRPFAVNLFAPVETPEPDPAAVDAMQKLLEPHRAELGLDPAEPRRPPWTALDQLAVVVEERVPAFSFTFGIPPLDGLDETIVLGTANTVDEAIALEQAGVHAVVAQGLEAGGHRSTFIGSVEDGLVPLAELVPAVAERVDVPVVAAGGIVDGAGIAAALRAGAAAAQLGTAFLYSHESGARSAWKDALREHETFLTAAYTGRTARGARTPFLAELDAGPEPLPYPLQRALLSGIAEQDGYGWYLGGTGAPRARELSASELVRVLVDETDEALAA